MGGDFWRHHNANYYYKVLSVEKSMNIDNDICTIYPFIFCPNQTKSYQIAQTM